MRRGARLAALVLGAMLPSACAWIARIDDVDRVDGGLGGASTASTGGGACPGEAGDAGCDGACLPETVFSQPGASPLGVAFHEGSAYLSLNGWNAVIGRTAMDAGFSVAMMTHAPEEVAADRDGVFWANYSESCLKRAPLDGGATSRLGACATGMNLAASKIALDATRAYWVAGADTPAGDVVTIDKGAAPDAGITVVAAAQPRAQAVAVDEDFVYWGMATQGPTPAGSIWRRARALTDSAKHFADAPGVPTALVIRDGYLYWVAVSGVAVYRRSTAEGSTTVEHIAPGASYYYSAMSLAVDDAHVYWTDATGNRVLRAAKAEGAPAETFVHDDLGSPGNVVVDCGAVYWTTPAAGTVRRLHK